LERIGEMGIPGERVVHGQSKYNSVGHEGKMSQYPKTGLIEPEIDSWPPLT
jgi:hypothetical protein